MPAAAAAGMAALVAAAAASGLIATSRSQTSSGTVADGVEQAQWKIAVDMARTPGRATSQERVRARTEGKRVAGLVTDVYDALFLTPAAVSEVVKDAFTKDAALALARSRAGTPQNASRVKTTKRSLRVSVDPDGAVRAAARVKVKAKVVAGERRVRLVHTGILWLERQGRRWSVIAFDVDQQPKG